MIRHSALYRGTVNHRRYTPIKNIFRYGLFMVYVDLDELSELIPENLFFSSRRRSVVRFAREDYIGDPGKPLAESVRAFVHERTGERPQGPIRLLTHLRYFGYSFNPVSFYYCFDKTGSRVETIVAEITNTPWKERFSYVLHKNENLAREGRHRYKMEKVFHVSPFWGMDHTYDWRFSEPGKKLSVHMENFIKEEKVFDATLSLRRYDYSQKALMNMVLQYPFMTIKVITLIYWQAIKLRMRGAKFYMNPGTVLKNEEKSDYEHEGSYKG